MRVRGLNRSRRPRLPAPRHRQDSLHLYDPSGRFDQQLGAPFAHKTGRNDAVVDEHGARRCRKALLLATIGMLLHFEGQYPPPKGELRGRLSSTPTVPSMQRSSPPRITTPARYLPRARRDNQAHRTCARSTRPGTGCPPRQWRKTGPGSRGCSLAPRARPRKCDRGPTRQGSARIRSRSPARWASRSPTCPIWPCGGSLTCTPTARGPTPGTRSASLTPPRSWSAPWAGRP